MKNLALAAAAALTLAACGTTNGGNGQSVASASAPAGAQYCWQDRLNTQSGKHSCNWAASKRDACEGTLTTELEATRVTSPKKSSMCSNGKWLVEVAPAG